MKIGEFSKKTGLSIHTIRYYENIGLMKKNPKDKSGHREYSEYDIEWARFISCLKATEMPLEKILNFIKLREKGDSTMSERLSIMKEQREKMEKNISLLNTHLAHIDYKIKNFENILKKLP
jgi:MerR family transcriptional regulator, aldehyde-responsive regulator